MKKLFCIPKLQYIYVLLLTQDIPVGVQYENMTKQSKVIQLLLPHKWAWPREIYCKALLKTLAFLKSSPHFSKRNQDQSLLKQLKFQKVRSTTNFNLFMSQKLKHNCSWYNNYWEHHHVIHLLYWTWSEYFGWKILESGENRNGDIGHCKQTCQPLSQWAPFIQMWNNSS